MSYKYFTSGKIIYRQSMKICVKIVEPLQQNDMTMIDTKVCLVEADDVGLIPYEIDH